MLMDEPWLLDCPPGADYALPRDVPVKEELSPFFSLQDVPIFVHEQGDIISIFRMDENADAGQGNSSPVLNFPPRAGEAGNTGKTARIFTDPQQGNKLTDDVSNFNFVEGFLMVRL